MKYKFIQTLSDTELLMLSDQGEFIIVLSKESGQVKISGHNYEVSKTLTPLDAYKVMKTKTYKLTLKKS